MTLDNTKEQIKQLLSDRRKSAILMAVLFTIVGVTVTQGTAVLFGMENYIEVHDLEASEATDQDGHYVHAIDFNYTAHTDFEGHLEIRLVDLENEDEHSPASRSPGTVVETWAYDLHIPEGESNGTHTVRPNELESGTYQYELELTIDATRWVDKTETYRTPPFSSDGIDSNESNESNVTNSSDRSGRSYRVEIQESLDREQRGNMTKIV